jgi:hypothetical protein
MNVMRASTSILSALIASVCWMVNAAEVRTNFVSIYLLESTEHRPWPSLEHTNLHNLKAASSPVLSDGDFVAFDTTNHTFTVTAKAAERLSRSIRGEPPTILRKGYYELVPHPTPFVLMVSGEPIYAGAFFTAFSSNGFDGPVIMADEVFIKRKVRPSARFSFSIQLGYPCSSRNTPDPRSDPRLVEAVQQLFGARPK